MEEACLPAVSNPKKPDAVTPRQACDTHFHLFGPTARFPYSAGRAYTPPEAPLEALLAMHARLGFERGVVVQGNAHGTDNTVLLDALKREPKRLRAISIVKDTTSKAELKAMADAGVRALRFHHLPHHAQRHSGLGVEAFEKLAPHMADLGMHVQFFLDAAELPNVMPHLKNWKRPIVLDHFGAAKATEGVKGQAFQTMRSLLAEGRIWIKISGTYRVSGRYPDYDDARALHEALLKTNPDQLVWGTDWPHPRLAKDMPDTGHLLDLFNAWTPDPALRRKILVDNPAKLYGFS
jgi:predicted TIM-barrel fold metal-dependent hydrolase